MSQVHTFAFFTGERSVSCIGVFGFGMHGLFAQHEQRCRKLSCTLCCWHRWDNSWDVQRHTADVTDAYASKHAVGSVSTCQVNHGLVLSRTWGHCLASSVASLFLLGCETATLLQPVHCSMVKEATVSMSVCQYLE